MERNSTTVHRILIVEDELLISANLARSLINLGYDVVAEVAEGEEAVQKAEETRPDLVLMDIMLEGDMDGIQAAERIRFGLDIPVVYVTGYAEKDVIERAKLTDPYGYLAKPIAHQELRNVIETALYKHQMYKRLKESEEKFRLLVDNAPIGIILVDTEGRIEEINNSLLKILGSPSAEATKSINMLTFPRLVKAGVSDVFRRCMQEAKPLTAELPYRSKWAKQSYLRLILTPRISNDGSVTGCQAVIEDVAARKRAEQALMRAKEEWEQTFDVVPDQLMILDKDHRILRANKAAVDAFGCTKDEVIGKPCFRLFHGTTAPPEFCPCEKLFRDGLNHDAEFTEERLGASFYVSAFPIREPDGRLKGCVHVARDITERKKDEALLLAQRTLSIALSGTSDLDTALRLSLDTALQVSDMDAAMIYLVNDDGALQLVAHKGVSDEAVRECGHVPADSPQARLMAADNPRYVSATDDKTASTMMGSEGFRCEVIVPVRHEERLIACFSLGSRGRGHISVRSRHALETTVGQVGSTIARIRAEMALRESEARYRDLFENARDMVYTCDLEGNCTSVNATAEPLLGYSLDEWSRLNFREIVDPAYLAITEAHFRKQVAGEVEITAPYEVMVRAKDGRPVWLEVTSRIMKRHGVPVGVHGTARDVSDRKQAELALTNSENKYRSLVESVPLGIVEIDLSGAITFANGAYCRMHDFEKDEVVGLSILDLRPSEPEKTRLRDFLQELVREQPPPTPWFGRDLTKTGEIVDVQVAWNYKRDGQGTVVGFIAVVTDITHP